MSVPAPAPVVAAATIQPPGPVMAKIANRPHTLSIIGLTFAVLAFGLAIIPPIAAGRPLLAPFDKPEVPEPPAEREGGLTLKFKELSVNIGGKAPKAKPVNQAIAIYDPIRWFEISAIVCALIGLAVATAAQMRERHTILTTASVVICVAAITWQYLIAGLVIGIAIAVLLLMLRSLADAF
jgi:hypothetical protein